MTTDADYGLLTSFDPVAAVERDALGLLDAAAVGLPAPVVHCPGWGVRHGREVHEF